MVLCLLHDGACTDYFENFREISLKGDLSNDITLNPPLFSLVNTFKPKLLAHFIILTLADFFLTHLPRFNYLWTYDLYGPAHKDFDAGGWITW